MAANGQHRHAEADAAANGVADGGLVANGTGSHGQRAAIVEERDEGPRGVWLWLPPLLLSCIFVPCVTYSEWYIDELFAVLRNPDARGESSLREVFSNDFWGNPLRGGAGSWTHKSYRPISVLTFALQFKLLGYLEGENDLFRPQPLRAFNVALHAANSLLVLALLRHGLRLPARWSRLAACLFAAHPVHAENVVYLVGRADKLATTGWLLAALAHLTWRNRRPRGAPPRLFATGLLLILHLILTVLTGLCKESGLTLLVFVAGIELSTPQAAPRRSLCIAAAALGIFVAVTLLRFQITQGAGAAFGYVDTPVQYHDNKEVRTWTYLFQHAFYGKLLVFPGDLSWDYSFDSLPLLRASWRDARALSVCTAYTALVALCSWSLSGRGGRRVLLGLQHVIVPFVPASNLFFTVGVTVGERLLYPSSAGAAIVLAAWGARQERPSEPMSAAGHGARRRRSSKLYALVHVILAVYIWRCGLRVYQWRSSEALFAADAAAWPRSVKTRHQVATVYHAQSRYEEALEHYNASLMVLDDNALTDHCIAQIFIETGRQAEALQRFEKILKGHGVGLSQHNLWMLYVDYGFVLVQARRFEEAIPALEHGLSRNTAVPHGLNALGYAQLSLHQLQQAQDTFAKGLEYDPENAIIWNNLGVLWMVAGALQQAAGALEKALTLEPNNPSVVQNAVLLRDAVQRGGALAGQPRLELFFTRSA